MTVKSDVTRQYLQKFPKTPSKQLAKMLHRDHSALYPSVENARCAVRRCRGAHGGQNRKYTPVREGERTPEESEAARANPFGLPEPEPETWRVFQLPTTVTRWLSLADVHFPFQDMEALTLAMQWGRDHECDGVLLDGDIADCYQLSRWEKDPRVRSFKSELHDLEMFLDSLVRTLKPTAIVWKEGNHEHRLQRYLMSRAPELFDSSMFSYREFLHLDERNVTWIEHGIPIEHKALTILHGDEYQGGVSSPVNPARGIYLKAASCCLVAHGHRSSEHTQRSVQGTTTTCWSQGCLCGLHPKYSPLNQWNHGFAMIDTASNWRINNYRIINGEVV